MNWGLKVNKTQAFFNLGEIKKGEGNMKMDTVLSYYLLEEADRGQVRFRTKSRLEVAGGPTRVGETVRRMEGRTERQAFHISQ